MMVVGQMNLIYLFEKREIKSLYKKFTWLTEHLSNRTIPGMAIKNFDAAIYSMDDEQKEKFAPELVITYGGHIVSKRLKQYLRNIPNLEHWHVSADGEIVDLFGKLTTVIEMNPFEFMERISVLMDNRTPQFPLVWENYCKQLPKPDFAYSEMSAIGDLIQKLPAESVLHLANSSTVRYAQLYQFPDTVEVCCNRGINGIEGTLSSALGYASGSDKLNFIVIGDLSFFYGMNGLWGNNTKPNVRILLLNNGGGEIFHTLPGLEMSGTSHKYITGVHHTSAKGWVESLGFTYLRADNEDELQAGMTDFMKSEGIESPIVLEVFTNKNKDARILKDYYKNLKTR